jgi:hypothetical protein
MEHCYVLSVRKEGDPRVATMPSPGNPFVQQVCYIMFASCMMLRGGLPQPGGAVLVICREGRRVRGLWLGGHGC